MRKTILLFVCTAVLNTASTIAQSRIVRKSTAAPKMVSPKALEQARTLPQELVSWPTADDDCSQMVNVSGVTDQWGFVTGTNGFGDLGKGQILTFDGSESYTVIGGVGFFVESGIVSDGEITAEVYTLDADGVPADLVATSNPVKVSDIVLDSANFIRPTIFVFPPESNMVLSDPSFLLNFDISNAYETNDTVALYHTNDNCGSGDDTWEKWDDGSWVKFSDGDGWAADLDLIVEAIVDFPDPTSTEAFIHQAGLTLYPASPNPALALVGINYEVEDVQDVTIHVLDARGKTIKQITRKRVRGPQTEQIDLSGFSSGIYYYTIESRDGRITSRFSKN